MARAKAAAAAPKPAAMDSAVPVRPGSAGPSVEHHPTDHGDAEGAADLPDGLDHARGLAALGVGDAAERVGVRGRQGEPPTPRRPATSRGSARRRTARGARPTTRRSPVCRAPARRAPGAGRLQVEPPAADLGGHRERQDQRERGQPGGHGPEAEQLLQVDRAVEHDAEQPELHEPHHHGVAGEAAVGEEPQVDQRVGGAELAHHEPGDQPGARGA